MYNNLYKSSNVNREQSVRIIKSNDIAARKLDNIANGILKANSDELGEDFMIDVSATNVSALLRDDDESGFKQINITNKNSVNSSTLQSSTKGASEIISKANEEAEVILAKAREEAAKIKEDAYKAGHDKGYEEGFASGKEALAKQEEELNFVKSRFDEEYTNRIDEIEPMLVDTLTDIYEYIFNVDFSDRKEVIYHLAKNTLVSMESGKKYILRLSTEDFGFLSMQKRELVKGSGIPIDDIELVEDKTLAHGHAYIESDGGIFDCSVTTHFENLKKTLQVLSYNKE